MNETIGKIRILIESKPGGKDGDIESTLTGHSSDIVPALLLTLADVIVENADGDSARGKQLLLGAMMATMDVIDKKSEMYAKREGNIQ